MRKRILNICRLLEFTTVDQTHPFIIPPCIFKTHTSTDWSGSDTARLDYRILSNIFLNSVQCHIAMSSDTSDQSRRFCVLSWDQVRRLNSIIREAIPIHGRGNFPTISLQPRQIVQVYRVRHNFYTEYMLSTLNRFMFCDVLLVCQVCMCFVANKMSLWHIKVQHTIHLHSIEWWSHVSDRPGHRRCIILYVNPRYSFSMACYLSYSMH